MEIKQCTKCILDTSDDSRITFDDSGKCNYCLNFEKKYINNAPTAAENSTLLKECIEKIKASKGKGGYDSVMGLSGGVDSSYLALKAKEWGLNPLLVHFDNGWNSELAVQNIESIVKYTGFDLYTYVVDWEEYRDLQRSYILSGVIDWEVPTDHGFFAVLYKQAHKRKISNVLAGFNYQTEAILPNNMSWRKQDLANLEDIHEKYGTIPLKTYPKLGFFKYNYYLKMQNIEVSSPLNFIEYNPINAKEEIIDKMGWQDYGGKHFESIFTRFYQGYVLPKKYGVDKRKAHLSNLINMNIIDRDQALEELNSDFYPEALRVEDKEYFRKKLGFTEAEFEKILTQKGVPHTNFKSYTTGLYVKHERFMNTVNRILRRR